MEGNNTYSWTLEGEWKLSIMESEKRHKGGITHAEEKALPVPG
jgi:hypothetical protein